MRHTGRRYVLRAVVAQCGKVYSRKKGFSRAQQHGRDREVHLVNESRLEIMAKLWTRSLITELLPSRCPGHSQGALGVGHLTFRFSGEPHSRTVRCNCLSGTDSR